jgi:spore protease
LADTGIHPGSGVGNKRLGITRETIGIPVVAVGVPTVVDAVTIADDIIEEFLNMVMHEAGQDSPVYTVVKSIAEGDKRGVMEEVMSPYGGNLMVTPKEIDTLIEDISRLIAGGINAALHPTIDSDDPGKYFH